MTSKPDPARQSLREAIERLPPITDEEEARIQAGIALDPDNPELTDEELSQLRPFKDVHPDLYESIKRAPGRPRLDAPRQAVTLRLSPATIARYKAIGGENWRARMTETLERAGG